MAIGLNEITQISASASGTQNALLENQAITGIPEIIAKWFPVLSVIAVIGLIFIIKK